MVRVEGRKIEAQPDEIIVGNVAYPRSLNPPVFPKGIGPQRFVLNTWSDGNYALSKQQLNNLAFDPMVKKSFEMGLPLASAREVTPFHRDVNLALREEGVLYDASGKLILGSRLAEAARVVNNLWIYTNDAFENNPDGKGYLGLDLVRVVGFDGNTPRLEREPLEKCVHGCWADIRHINRQGFYTTPAEDQKFKQGETVYAHKPVAGSVVWLYAYSIGAGVDAVRGPLYADPRLGGILRAEGTPRKIEGEQK